MITEPLEAVELGKYEQAEMVYKRALKICEQVFGLLIVGATSSLSRHASTCSSVRPCCHLSDKNYRFSDNLPHSQALLEDQLSRITWILRKFADSGKKHFRWKRADVLRKPNSFFDLL